MCGIAGLIHRKKTGDIGTEMTKMLKSLKHRGPDSTGFALYGKPKGNELVLRFKVAEQEDMAKGFDIHQQVKDRRAEVDKVPHMIVLGAKEKEAGLVAVRSRADKGLEGVYPLSEFITRLNADIRARKLPVKAEPPAAPAKQEAPKS